MCHWTNLGDKGQTRDEERGDKGTQEKDKGTQHKDQQQRDRDQGQGRDRTKDKETDR